MSIFLRWFLANLAGMTIGLGTHPFLAHGFTGRHGDSMTAVQWIAHIVSFGLASAIIFSCQRKSAPELFQPGAAPVLRASALATVAFLGVWSVAGIPFDILASFLTFGLSLGLALRNRSREAMLALTAATAVAGVVTVGSGLPIAGRLTGAFGGGLAGDATLWTYIGVVGGVSSGLLGWFALRRLVAKNAVTKVGEAAAERML
jgi:hypothetical protein